MSAVVFMDTETTGLALDDDIWEFAAIRREPDGSEHSRHLFIRHDVRKCAALPEPFLGDHRARFPTSDTPQWHEDAKEPHEAARLIAELFCDRPHVVGAVPNFDTERIALLLGRFGLKPGWHYHLIDVENLAVGWLRGRLSTVAEPWDPGWTELVVTKLPWDSDKLSRACGVEPPGDGVRHTAMGDVRWALALYDRITGGIS